MTTCPPTHKHAETSTCKKNHRCECRPCWEAETVRNTARQRVRRRAKAYGTYKPDVPALGTQRRIQGLLYLGWTLEHIGAVAGGVTSTAIGLLLTRETVAPETADRIRQATAELMRRGPGPSNITRCRARAKGYVSPLAWDDFDADVAPVVVREPDRGKFDEVAIELVVSGQRVALNLREREEVIRRLNALRWPDPRIAKAIGVDKGTINRTRLRLNLPTWGYHERATEYGQEQREKVA